MQLTAGATTRPNTGKKGRRMGSFFKFISGPYISGRKMVGGGPKVRMLLPLPNSIYVYIYACTVADKSPQDLGAVTGLHRRAI